MFVSGFTIIRNARKYDYPVVEAIRSILPLCDECVVAVGKSEDDTLELIRSMQEPKIRIIETVWDDTLRKGGEVLAKETDKAFAAIDPRADWAFYIQADECIHEAYYPAIRAAMEQYKSDISTEGLLFYYTHFYGSYDFVADSRKWYRREVRIIRNDKDIRSYKDAQGFRKNGQKLRVKQINAQVYHYGWVKHPHAQKQKELDFNKLWHDDAWMEQNIAKTEAFDYSKIDSLALFTNTHPAVYRQRIGEKNWTFDHDPTLKKLSFKSRLLMWIERKTGWRIGEYRNYRLR